MATSGGERKQDRARSHNIMLLITINRIYFLSFCMFTSHCTRLSYLNQHYTVGQK